MALIPTGTPKRLMNETTPINADSIIKVLLWIGSAIAINVAITVWLISQHNEGSHGGSVSSMVFSEYRTATEWRHDNVVRELADRNTRFERLMDAFENRLDAVEKGLYVYESRQHQKQNTLPAERERKQLNIPDW